MYIGRVNCLRAHKEISPLKMKRSVATKKSINELKRIVRRMRFSERLFAIAIKIFMWAMRIEKRKYPVYWKGSNYKLFKFSTWATVFCSLLARELKVNLQAACFVSMIDKKVTCGKLEFTTKHNLFYEKLCIHGADIFRREAKLRGEKY